MNIAHTSHKWLLLFGKQIVCQDSADDDNNLEQGNQPSREGIRGGDEIGDLQQEDIHHVDGFQHAYNGWKREFGSRRAEFNSGPHDKSQSDRVVILPSEEPHSYHPDSRGKTSVYPGRKPAVAHDSKYGVILNKVICVSSV